MRGVCRSARRIRQGRPCMRSSCAAKIFGRQGVRMKRILPAFLASAAVALAETPRVPAASATQAKPEFPGPQPDGAVLLPNQWQLRPAGKQIVVGDFPASMALHPEGKF